MGCPLSLSKDFLLPSGKWLSDQVALSPPSYFSPVAVHFLNSFLISIWRKADVWNCAVLPALLGRRWCSFTKSWRFLQDGWVATNLKPGFWRQSQGTPRGKSCDWEVPRWPFLWGEPRRLFPSSVLHTWGDSCSSLLARLQYHLLSSSLAAQHTPRPLYELSRESASLPPCQGCPGGKQAVGAHPVPGGRASLHHHQPGDVERSRALANIGVPSSADSTERLPQQPAGPQHGTPTWRPLRHGTTLGPGPAMGGKGGEHRPLHLCLARCFIRYPSCARGSWTGQEYSYFCHRAFLLYLNFP